VSVDHLTKVFFDFGKKFKEQKEFRELREFGGEFFISEVK
jgi:hypothetical protein